MSTTINKTMKNVRRGGRRVVVHLMPTGYVEPQPTVEEVKARDDAWHASRLCNKVTLLKTNAETGKQTFNTCTRRHCKFAHSIQSFRPGECNRGEECRHRNGRRIKGANGKMKFNKNAVCKFIHPDESVLEWAARTRFGKALPLTDGEVRLPLDSREWTTVTSPSKSPRNRRNRTGQSTRAGQAARPNPRRNFQRQAPRRRLEV